MKKGDKVILKTDFDQCIRYRFNFLKCKIVPNGYDENKVNKYSGYIGRVYKDSCYIAWNNGGQSREKITNLVFFIN